MPYAALDFDLATERDRVIIDKTLNSPVHAVHVISLPTGADVKLHVEGRGSDGWPLKNQGLIFRLRGYRKGVHISNPAGGGILTLGITFSEGTTSTK